MKPADLQILGGLFGDFQQGVNFGRGIQNDNQRRRLAEQENSRQERQLQAQMAEAQVRAERARQEMKLDPEKFQLEKDKQQLYRDQFGFGVRKYEEAPQREQERFGRKVLEGVAGGFKSPTTIAQAYGMSPQALATPEGQAQLKAMQDEEYKRALNQSVEKTRKEAYIRQNAMTKGAEDRQKFKTSITTANRPSKQIMDMSRLTTDRLKAMDADLATPEDKELFLRNQLRVAKEVIMKRKTENPDITPSQGDQDYLNYLESMIRSLAPQQEVPVQGDVQGPALPGPTSMRKPVQQMSTEELLAELQRGLA